MVKQTVAQRLALQSMATTTQANLRLPIEIIDEIFSIHIAEHCQPRKYNEEFRTWSMPHRSTPLPYQLLTACKLFHRLAVPHIYKHVHLDGKGSYFNFLQRTNLESYRHIDRITFYNLDLGSKTALQQEELHIAALEKRAEVYRKAVVKETGQEYEWAWPQHVEFEQVVAARTHHKFVKQAFVCRIMKLFTMQKLHAIGGFHTMVYSFDPSPAGSSPANSFIIPEVHCHMAQKPWAPYQTFIGPSHDEGFNPKNLAIYPMTGTIDKLFFDCKPLEGEGGGTLTTICETLDPIEIDYLDRLDQMCEGVITSVTVTPAVNPHAFCCDQKEDIGKVRSPKLQLTCCEGLCEESKTWREHVLSRFLRLPGFLRDTFSQVIDETLDRYPMELTLSDDEDDGLSDSESGGSDLGSSSS